MENKKMAKNNDLEVARQAHQDAINNDLYYASFDELLECKMSNADLNNSMEVFKSLVGDKYQSIVELWSKNIATIHYHKNINK